MIDVLIKGGDVVDGSGAPARKANLAIEGGRIAELTGAVPEAARVIDAEGLVVAPGFIDIHSHSDLPFLLDADADSKLRQGVTTEVVGNCGMSPAPLVPGRADELWAQLAFVSYGVEPDWESFGEFLARLDALPPPVNLVPLVGHLALRSAVVGQDDRLATEEEIKRMRSLLARSIGEGAWGCSTGLIYPPAMFASVEEVAALAEEAGYCAIHMRDEGERLLEALDEAIEVARLSGATVEVSHLKAAGKSNWGKMSRALEKLETASRESRVAADCYPYTAGSTTLTAVLPRWAANGGVDAMLARLRSPGDRPRISEELSGGGRLVNDWESVVVSSVESERNKGVEGKPVARIARETGKEPAEVVMDLLLEEEAKVSMVTFLMDEKEVAQALSHPLVVVGSDGLSVRSEGPLARGKPHPRYYGTFPRFLGEFVREKGVCSLAEGVRKLTSEPARRLGLHDRGWLEPGKAADVVAFDYGALKDRATYEEPHRYPEGIEYVIVNGAIAVEDGHPTGVRAGHVLRH